MIYIDNIWDSVSKDYNAFHLELIENYIRRLKSNPIDICDKKILQFLESNKYNLISNKIDDLKLSIDCYENTFNTLDYRELVSERVNRRIGYEIINRKEVDGNPLAYKLAECFSDNGYRWCPFCQLNHVVVLVGAEKKFRPAFDHYFCKSKYPFLALSLYNLIPICGTCNSIPFKGTKDFYWKEHLHPIFDEEEIDFDFNYSLNFIEKDNEFEVDIKNFDISTIKKNKKIANNNDTFNIDYLYKNLSKERCFEVINDYIEYKNKSEVRLSGFDILNDKFKPGINNKSYKKITMGKMLFDLKKKLMI